MTAALTAVDHTPVAPDFSASARFTDLRDRRPRASLVSRSERLVLDL